MPDFDLGDVCDSFEHEPDHHDPTNPTLRYCVCGWSEDVHAGAGPPLVLPACPGCGATDRWHVDAEVTFRCYITPGAPDVIRVDATGGTTEAKLVQIGVISCDRCACVLDDVTDASVWVQIRNHTEANIAATVSKYGPPEIRVIHDYREV